MEIPQFRNCLCSLVKVGGKPFDSLIFHHYKQTFDKSETIGVKELFHFDF